MAKCCSCSCCSMRIIILIVIGCMLLIGLMMQFQTHNNFFDGILAMIQMDYLLQFKNYCMNDQLWLLLITVCQLILFGCSKCFKCLQKQHAKKLVGGILLLFEIPAMIIIMIIFLNGISDSVSGNMIIDMLDQYLLIIGISSDTTNSDCIVLETKEHIKSLNKLLIYLRAPLMVFMNGSGIMEQFSSGRVINEDYWLANRNNNRHVRRNIIHKCDKPKLQSASIKEIETTAEMCSICLVDFKESTMDIKTLQKELRKSIGKRDGVKAREL